MMKWISGVLGIAALFGLIWKLDGYVAHADDLRLVEMRLDQKIQADRANALQQRTWNLEKEYTGEGKPAPPEAVKIEIQENNREIKEIQDKLKSGAK